MAELIKAGESVVIHYNDEEGGSLIRASGEQKIGKSRYTVCLTFQFTVHKVLLLLFCVIYFRLYVKSLIGVPYGSVFRVVDRRLEYVGDGTTASFEYFRDDDLPSESLPQCIPGDNRSYADTNTAQKLADVDIKKLREEGFSGVDIIKSLISNSDTFNAKTSFAQEKWCELLASICHVVFHILLLQILFILF